MNITLVVIEERNEVHLKKKTKHVCTYVPNFIEITASALCVTH